MLNKTILSISNIKKSFGSKTVLNNLSYDFRSNEMYAIVGESGNGKTTLLNILGLIDNSFEGEIKFDGQRIINKKDYSFLRAKKIGYIFQSYYLIDSLSVKENIVLPLKYSRNEFEEEYFNKIINQLNISSILEDRVNYLSGGEKQRVAIARALINKPKLIICDEPTGNLDPKNTEKVIEILSSFKGDDKTIIMVTHSNEVAQKCTKILNLSGGQLYEQVY